MNSNASISGEMEIRMKDSYHLKLKESIRKQILEARSNMPMEECIEKSRHICDKIIASSFYKKAKIIYIYMAFRNEVDLSAVIANARKEGKCIAIPRINTDMHSMEFFVLSYTDTGMPIVSPGYFGIAEPPNFSAPAPQPDLMIIPGVAFDKERNRIGYGKGYYDAYMNRIKEQKVVTIGVAYSCQIVDVLPIEAHDFRPDVVMTELEER